MLLLLLLVVGIAEANAQSTEYLSVEKSHVILEELQSQAKDVRSTNKKMPRIVNGFYGTVIQNLEDGMTIEAALNAAQGLVNSKVLYRNWATPAEIQQLRSETEDLLRQ